MTFHKAVLDAGEFATDIAAVEVWTLNFEGNRLECPNGGWWLNPKFVNSNPSEALFQLLLASSIEPVRPGQGLPGILFNDSQRIRDNLYSSLPSEEEVLKILSKEEGSMNSVKTTFSDERRCDIEVLLHKIRANSQKESHQNIKWMNTADVVKYLERDSDERAKLMSQSNLRYLAAVPFNFRAHKGIVIYFSQKKRKRWDNEYLLRAADLIGISSALENPHRFENEKKIEQSSANFRHLIGIGKLASTADHLKSSFIWRTKKISI